MSQVQEPARRQAARKWQKRFCGSGRPASTPLQETARSRAGPWACHSWRRRLRFKKGLSRFFFFKDRLKTYGAETSRIFLESLPIYLPRSSSHAAGTLFSNPLPNSEKQGTDDILTAHFPTYVSATLDPCQHGVLVIKNHGFRRRCVATPQLKPCWKTPRHLERPHTRACPSPVLGAGSLTPP